MARLNKIHTERLTVYMGKGLQEKLRDLAVDMNCSDSEAVRWCINFTHEKKNPPSRYQPLEPEEKARRKIETERILISERPNLEKLNLEQSINALSEEYKIDMNYKERHTDPKGVTSDYYVASVLGTLTSGDIQRPILFVRYIECAMIEKEESLGEVTAILNLLWNVDSPRGGAERKRINYLEGKEIVEDGDGVIDITGRHNNRFINFGQFND